MRLPPSLKLRERLKGWVPVQLRLMCQPYNSVVVRILPPYVPSEREVAQPRLFADNVRRLFSQELRLPLVEQVRFPPHQAFGVHTHNGCSSKIGCQGMLLQDLWL